MKIANSSVAIRWFIKTKCSNTLEGKHTTKIRCRIIFQVKFPHRIIDTAVF